MLLTGTNGRSWRDAARIPYSWAKKRAVRKAVDLEAESAPTMLYENPLALATILMTFASHVPKEV